MKFFVFNISETSLTSQRASDTGLGISIFCVPTDKLSNITSSKGFIHITFDNAGIYEQTSIDNGDAIQKVSVSLAAKEGEEIDLITNILDFITSTPEQRVLTFDLVNNIKTFRSSNVNSESDIKIQVPTVPINMETGKLSVGDQTKQFQDTIAGVNFRGNLPILDFNHEGLTQYADGDEITSWQNAGTGGSTYSIASNALDPSCNVSTSSSLISTKAATVGVGEYFIIPNSFTVQNDYTLYCVLDVTTGPIVLYGDSDGETIGFGGFIPKGTDGISGIGYEVKNKKSIFSVRHKGMTGFPATTNTDNTDNATTDYTWPKLDILEVFIIRRDKDFNVYLHNGDGDIIGFIPAKTGGTDDTHVGFRTDGDLLIERLGTSGNMVGLSGAQFGKFKGDIARFGVIPNDIGVSKSVSLAQDLVNFYKV